MWLEGLMSKRVHCFEKNELFAMLKISKPGYLEQRLKICLVIKSFLWQKTPKMWGLLLLVFILWACVTMRNSQTEINWYLFLEIGLKSPHRGIDQGREKPGRLTGLRIKTWLCLCPGSCHELWYISSSEGKGRINTSAISESTVARKIRYISFPSLLSYVDKPGYLPFL